MFRVELQVAEGVNFPYYVMGKAQLRILPFADPWVWTDPQADPYALFAQEYGAERSDIGDIEKLWYNWLSRISFSCPDNARGSLRCCDDPLLSIAQGVLPEYLTRWPDINSKLTGLVREAASDADLSSGISRNEQRFGLSYPDGGREVIHVNHFPTTATQHPGAHFVLGMGCLARPDELLRVIESEVGLKLLAQILEDEQVASHCQQLEDITGQDDYVQGFWSLLEAVNGVVRAIERRGASVTLEEMPRKPGERGFWQITESLFRNRHLWGEAGLIEFVRRSLDDLQ